MKQNVWIIGAVLLVIIMSMKGSNLFALVPPGQSVIFRTTDLTYTLGGAVAYSSTCGGALTPYGSYTNYGAYSGNCANAMINLVGCTSSQLLASIPGGWVTGYTGTELLMCIGTKIGYVFVCNTVGGTSSELKSYRDSDPDGDKVSLDLVNSPDLAKDLLCGTCIDTTWTPDPSTICLGESFTQTSNCGTTRGAVGTKDCVCTPSWSCASWSICSVDCTQTRICTDINNCGVDTGKPIESQSCTGGSCVVCPTMEELTSCRTVTREDLSSAIMSWVNG